jgi:hypothetical protein
MAAFRRAASNHRDTTYDTSKCDSSRWLLLAALIVRGNGEPSDPRLVENLNFVEVKKGGLMIANHHFLFPGSV